MTTGLNSSIKPIITRETWVAISIMAAPTFRMEVSFTPMTFIAMSNRTIPIDVAVPMIGDSLNGIQK